MSTNIAPGTRVRATGIALMGENVKGLAGTVIGGNNSHTYVQFDAPYTNTDERGGQKCTVVRNERLKVEEYLADWEKELLGIETKQEEPEVKQELKVGDTVRVLKTSNWHKLGETGKVTEVDGLSIRVNDWWISPKEVELVTEKPKAKSQEIELGDVQKNDLIVCFWSQGGVELRKKGVAHEKDDDGDWIAEGRAFLTYDVCLDAAEHVYLLERPEATGFDALDKAKKYLVKGRDGVTDFVLAFEEDIWTYGRVGDNTRVKAKQYEKGFTEGNGSWEKPVEYKEPEIVDGTYWVTGDPSYFWKVVVKDGKATWTQRNGRPAYASMEYLLKVKQGTADYTFHTVDPTPEPSNLEKFERAGVIGNRYRTGNVLYKVTKKGKVKGIIMDDAQDSWQTVIWDFETFQDYVDRGIIHKIS